jgi:adenylate kinase
MPYDSSTAKIVKRLQEHEHKTIPVIKKYEQLHDFKIIDGVGTFEEVFERTVADIEKGIRRI